MNAAKAHNIRVRGYVSCIVDCPYEGAIAPEQVVKVVKRLYDMGCYEVSLGETIGTATPDRVQKVWQACLAELDSKVLAGHFHNTYGMAIANIYQSLQQGIRVLIRLLQDLEVALMPKAPLAMYQPKICFICCHTWVLKLALT